MAKKTSDQRPIVKDDPSRIIQSSLEAVSYTHRDVYKRQPMMFFR